jgi:hypothetical protein
MRRVREHDERVGRPGFEKPRFCDYEVGWDRKRATGFPDDEIAN